MSLSSTILRDCVRRYRGSQEDFRIERHPGVRLESWWNFSLWPTSDALRARSSVEEVLGVLVEPQEW